MIELKSIINWIKNHYKVAIGGVGLLFGAIALALSRNNRINNPATALKVQKEAKVITEKEILAEQLEQHAEDKSMEIDALEADVANSKKRIAIAMHGPVVERMTDAEIADLYRKSGL